MMNGILITLAIIAIYTLYEAYNPNKTLSEAGIYLILFTLNIFLVISLFLNYIILCLKI